MYTSTYNVQCHAILYTNCAISYPARILVLHIVVLFNGNMYGIYIIDFIYYSRLYVGVHVHNIHMYMYTVIN